MIKQDTRILGMRWHDGQLILATIHGVFAVRQGRWQELKPDRWAIGKWKEYLGQLANEGDSHGQ